MDVFAEQQDRRERVVATFAGNGVLSHPQGLVGGISLEIRSLLHGMARDVRGRRESLAFAMRHLAERLEQEARRVEAGSNFNSLGIVQGHGAEVDRQAGELGVLTDAFHHTADVVMGEAGIVDLTRQDVPETEGLRRCPRCNSPAPNLHPAMQHEGEVQTCSHPWHGGEARAAAQ